MLMNEHGYILPSHLLRTDTKLTLESSRKVRQVLIATLERYFTYRLIGM